MQTLTKRLNTLSRKWKRYKLPAKLFAEWARGPVGKKSVSLPHGIAFGRAFFDMSLIAPEFLLARGYRSYKRGLSPFKVDPPSRRKNRRC